MIERITPETVNKIKSFFETDDWYSEEFLRGLWEKAELRALEYKNSDDRVTQAICERLADSAYTLSLNIYEFDTKITNRIKAIKESNSKTA